MTIRDREVFEELRDDPELLAIADAVVETQRLRRIKPVGLLAGIAVAAVALFALVLAAPWGGDGGGGFPDQALAAIGTQGPVTHLTTSLDSPGAQSLTAESFYDPRTRLLRVVTRDEGSVVSDFTTRATEDEFTTFPGLLDAAAFYRTALANGQAKVVGEGDWHGRPVSWVQLRKPGGFPLRIGLDRSTFRPVVFRGLNADGTPAGFDLAVLGFDYVSPDEASFDTTAPVLVRGQVFGPDCRPTKARVDAFLEGSSFSKAAVASGRAGKGGSFTLRLDPSTLPIRVPVRRAITFRLNVQGPHNFAFKSFRRSRPIGDPLRSNGWDGANDPIRVELTKPC
jgi:hypothetical protein